MADMPSETYSCQCQGCPNGFGSSFSAAPESWWAEKGMTPPKNCPDCRAWVKEQTDEAVRCQGCRGVIRVPARYKISHHKRIGQYVLRRECHACERGTKPPPSAGRRPEELREIERKTNAMLDLRRLRPNSSYVLNLQVSDYDRLIPRSTQTRREHVECHIAGSPSVVNKEKSASSLAAQAGTFESILQSASLIAGSSNSNLMVEYRAKHDRIVKVTMVASGSVEVTLFEGTAGPNGHDLVTTYDEFSIRQVKQRVDSSQWT